MVDITKQTLLKTLEAVTGKREDDYGDKLKNHQNIADLWSIYLKTKISHYFHQIFLFQQINK